MLCADCWTGRTRFTCGALEFGVIALAGATLTYSSAVTELLVAGQTCSVVQRTVTGTSRPHGITDAHSALTASVT